MKRKFIVAKTQSITPTIRDYQSVLGNLTSVSTRGNTKVCICACVYCKTSVVGRRLVNDQKIKAAFR